MSRGPGIHQFVPMLHRYDAVGEHSRSLRDRLLAEGIPSRIYSEIPDPATEEETRPYRRYASDAVGGDLLVYQFATRSAMASWLAARAEPLVLNYHSLTPPEYFGPWNNAITRLQVGARAELAVLATRAVLGIAVSEFDATELRAAGCAQVEVVPVANVRVPPVEPDPAVVDAVRAEQPGPGARWLSVGRLAPNKAHHRTIAALFVARRSGVPATLTVVGAPTVPAYARALRRYAAELGLADAVRFVSGIDEDRLAAHYRVADVLVMLSGHEGFGVPLVEAMGQGLPIVAYDAGAVREVTGDAALLLDATGPRRVASAVSGLLADRDERTRRAAAGRARFDVLDLGGAGKLLVEAVRARWPGAEAAPPAGSTARAASSGGSDQVGCEAMDDRLHTVSHAVGSGASPRLQTATETGPHTDIFQRLLKERIVFIGSAIDQGTANLVCAQLILLEAENPDRDIAVYINSPGGSVTDGLAIYDTMQYVRCDVRTICVGLAASMGQFLLCAGTPGKRFALPHSRILMHQPSGQMQGQAADIAIQAEQIIYLKRMMAERIAFHTGQSVERIEADSDRDRWFTAEEAREYGFIDEVIQKDAMEVPSAGSGASST